MRLPEDQYAVLHVIGSLGDNHPKAAGIARICGHGENAWWASQLLQNLKNRGLVRCGERKMFHRWSLTEAGRLALNPRGDGGGT